MRDDEWVVLMWDEYMDRVYENNLARREEEREAEGRCGTCGAFNGPDHECPHITKLRRTAPAFYREVKAHQQRWPEGLPK